MIKTIYLYIYVEEEAIETQWMEWSLCSPEAKSRDRTLQDGCLIDDCETLTEECIPQGKSI